MDRLGLRSLWKGHNPIRLLPRRMSLMPRASASRWMEISRLIRSFNSGGTYGIASRLLPPVFRASSENLSRTFCAPRMF